MVILYLPTEVLYCTGSKLVVNIEIVLLVVDFYVSICVLSLLVYSQFIEHVRHFLTLSGPRSKPLLLSLKSLIHSLLSREVKSVWIFQERDTIRKQFFFLTTLFKSVTITKINHCLVNLLPSWEKWHGMMACLPVLSLMCFPFLVSLSSFIHLSSSSVFLCVILCPDLCLHLGPVPP